MSTVRQAHLPGNYQLADPELTEEGPAICKGCWEGAETQTMESLQTVWVSLAGWRMIWWLCNAHADSIVVTEAGPTIIRRVDGFVRSPGL